MSDESVVIMKPERYLCKCGLRASGGLSVREELRGSRGLSVNEEFRGSRGLSVRGGLRASGGLRGSRGLLVSTLGAATFCETVHCYLQRSKGIIADVLQELKYKKYIYVCYCKCVKTINQMELPVQ